MKTTITRLTLVFVSLIVLGLIFTFQSYAKVDIKNCVAAFTFDDKVQGDTAEDISGNENHGELVSKPKWVEGHIGDAIELNGAGQGVRIPDFGTFAPESEITIMTWIELGSDGNQHLFILQPPDWNNRIEADFPWTNGTANINWQIHQAPWCGMRLPDDTLGNWQHWAFVNSVSGKFMKIYKEGSVVAEIGEGHTFVRSGASFFIGGDGGNWTGIVDEFAIFDVALTEDDINEIRKDGLSRVLLAVSPSGKLATTWGKVKAQY